MIGFNLFVDARKIEPNRHRKIEPNRYRKIEPNKLTTNKVSSWTKMELPDDVLQLIREYAKPWFKHHALYKLILVNTGRYSFLELRNCLQCIPDQILPTLVKFQAIHAEFVVARDNYVEEPWHYSTHMEYYDKRSIYFKSQLEVNRLVQLLCRIYEFKRLTC